MLAAQEHALDVDREHAPPLVERLGLEGRRRRPQDAGIVHQTIQLALARQHLVDDALPVGLARCVVLVETGPSPVFLAADLLDGLEAPGAIDVGDDHRRAFGGEQLRRGAADARSRARDQHDLACNPAHAFLPQSFLRQG